MYKDEVLIKYQGFHPSDFTKTFLQGLLSELHEESPSGSTLKADFSRKDHVFKAVISIHSSAGKFFAVASGRKLREVTDKIIDQIRKQLDRWKSARFEHRSIKNLPRLDENYIDGGGKDYDYSRVS